MIIQVVCNIILNLYHKGIEIQSNEFDLFSRNFMQINYNKRLKD